MNRLRKPQPNLFDIIANRHKGEPHSVAANLRTNKSKDRHRILAFIRQAGTATTKEIVRGLGMLHQTASARRSDLLAEGAIEKTGETREHSGVVRIKERK